LRWYSDEETPSLVSPEPVMKKVSSGRASGKSSGAAEKKIVYRVTNWSAYEQGLIQRGRLDVWVSEDVLDAWRYTGPPQQGAQFYYSDLAIETALTIRKLFKLPLRQTEGFVQSLLDLLGLALEAPDHTTLSRRQEGLPIDLGVQPSRKRRHLVVDSTGLKLYGEGEWQVREHGWTKRRTWRKLHLGTDAETGEITAETLTEASVDDASQVRPILAQTEGEVARFYGDGAYDRWRVHYALAYPPSDTSPPIEAVIPPRRDAALRTAKQRYRHLEARNERVCKIRRQGRKRWKRESGYHRRSVAESSMARYKRILGPQLMARSWPAQQTEARIGCAILNRMIQLGKSETVRVERSA